MLSSILLDACLEEGIDFFTGVPDSFLKGLCDELFARYGTSGPKHTVAHNEGGAIGLCAGHYLATGRPALCYMQNSGLGNTVNPLTSLMDEAVYALPCLLVIGWRGEPGVKDEPQHVKQGAITLSQLELLGIPYFVLSPEHTEEQFREAFRNLMTHLRAGKTAAIVARKGALKTILKPDYGNSWTLSRERAAEIILGSMGQQDIVVSTTGKLSREIFEIRERSGDGHARDFLTVGSMGHASMIALQIARDKPDRRVWCLDGDGAALMHLGAMSIISQAAPKNLIHVVIENGAHETVGGMPVCCGKLPLPEIALAVRYPVCLEADNEKELREALARLEDPDCPRPAFLTVHCACGARADLGRPTTTPAQNRDAFMNFLK